MSGMRVRHSEIVERKQKCTLNAYRSFIVLSSMNSLNEKCSIPLLYCRIHLFHKSLPRESHPFSLLPSMWFIQIFFYLSKYS